MYIYIYIHICVLFENGPLSLCFSYDPRNFIIYPDGNPRCIMYKKDGQFRARSGGNFDIFLSFFRWLTWQKWDGEGERGLLRSITRNNFATVFKAGKRRLRLIISNSIMQITRLARANDTREVRAMSPYSISACSYFAFLVTPLLRYFSKIVRSGDENDPATFAFIHFSSHGSATPVQ